MKPTTRSKFIKVDGRTFMVLVDNAGIVTINGLPGFFRSIQDARKALRPIKIKQ